MNQLSFSEAEYTIKKRKTPREKFLEQMDTLLPWKQMENKIRRYYAKAGNERQPYPLKVLHGDERRVWVDAGYVGVEKREEHTARQVEWFIAKRPGKLKVLPKHAPQRRLEKLKAQVRSNVEHPFLWIKKIFGYSKVRYRGLSKNENRLYMLSAFYNVIRMNQLAH